MATTTQSDIKPKMSFIYHDEKFTHGDKVTCFIGHTFIEDAKINIMYDEKDPPVEGTICQNVTNDGGARAFGYKYSHVFVIRKGMNGKWDMLEKVSKLKHAGPKDELVSSVANVIGSPVYE